MSVASSRPPTPGAPNLRALKILVVVMGIAIVASVIVIVVAISNRLADKETAGRPGAETVAAAPAAAELATLGDLSIAIPEGCVIAEASAEGRRLILRFDGLATRGCQQVVLIDLESGTILGRVTATPGG